MEYQIRHYYDDVEEQAGPAISAEKKPEAAPRPTVSRLPVQESGTTVQTARFMQPDPRMETGAEAEPEFEEEDTVVVAELLRKKRPHLIFLALACAAALAGTVLWSGWKQQQEQAAALIAQQQAQQQAQEEAARKAAEEAAAAEAERQARYAKAESWELLMASVVQPMLTDPEGEMVEAPGSDQLIDARIAEPLEALRAAGEAAGFDFVVTVGYRSYAKQDEIFQRYVRQAERRGLTGLDAQADAALYCAVPGTGDHQTALAVHLIDDGCQDMSAEAYAATDAYDWLMANCAAYGFVLRYPAEKAEDTGFSFEPWHFRYVGVENAREMTRLGMCLEEYIAYLLR